MPVEGRRSVAARFYAIPRAVRRAARRELERNAEEIVSEMKAFAPRGRTGRLAVSIGWTWGEAPEGTLTVGTVGSREFGTMRITIFAGGGEAYYAKFQEFGTVKMAANPFFFPVWRIRKRRTRGRITRAINKAIKEASGR